MLQLFWNGLLGLLSGPVLEGYRAKLEAQTDANAMGRDIALKRIDAEIEARKGALEIRLATAGFWEMRLITSLIAGCFTLHLVLVTLDTCFQFGWGIPAFPEPFDEWQGVILLSFFGVQIARQGVMAIAAAIIRR